MKLSTKTQNGFTLVEMAVVMVIVTLLIGAALIPLSVQVEQNRRSETGIKLEEIKEALTGFAIVNRRLPCPDTDGDGQENACAGGAIINTGTIPWVNLGITGIDSWGNNIRYAVDDTFVVAPLTLATVGTLDVDDAGGCPGAYAAAQDVPAVFWSDGKTGYTSGYENENNDGDACFVFRSFSNIAGSEYDDLLTWISPSILFNRMVAAGSLP